MADDPQPPPSPFAGLRGQATLVVAPEHTAQAFASGNAPVFSTPRMIALMEAAAVNAVEAGLSPGDISLGTRVDIAHLAATPVGETVRAEAEVVGGTPRRLVFRVTAWDEHEKIGEGSHERAVVSGARFMDRVKTKQR
jgi:fluoroacetyl-CoA thioesterase